MDILWQQIAIGVALVGAVSYLIWHFVRGRRKKDPCAMCAAKQAFVAKPGKPADPAPKVSSRN